jgi:hypothetical protein
MIAQMLASCGLFIGQGEMVHWEAPFFQQINDLLLSQVGGSWDNFDDVPYLLQDEAVRAVIGDYLRYLLQTRHAISFLGWRKFWQYRDVCRLDVPWGWKDPRSTITLPFWLDVFPEAKVIHIVRHGVDVASSLSARYQRKFKITTQREQFWRYWLRPKHGRFTNSKVTQISLEFCFALWEKYLSSAGRNLGGLPNEVMTIRYETFLQQPGEGLRALADFCGLNPGERRIAELAQGANPDRAYRYRADARLQAFALAMAERLAVYGY